MASLLRVQAICSSVTTIEASPERDTIPPKCDVLSPSHFPIKICNNAMSEPYTVPVPLIGDVRRVLEAMCSDPSVQDRDILRHVYTKSPLHPANRYSDSVREK